MIVHLPAAPVGVKSSVHMQFATGNRIGPYEITGALGAGGMGVVYKARDTRLNRLVALKVLSADMVSNPERKRRFIQEAQAASALNHPNIITIHDIGNVDGIDFLVMEYVAGKTLAELISSKSLPAVDAVKYATQVAGALAAAHGAGIVHRDLKPANVMVSEAGFVKVLDFGLAKLQPEARPNAETETELGVVMGTAAYMSPEQAEGRRVDARSDIFSFGAMLYEMLSGRRAFLGETVLATMASVLKSEPPPIDAPQELERIVSRCLRKDPGSRFQSMAEVRQGLEGAKLVERVPSIAVLPFANLSNDKENEYFSDGLAEEIINALTHLPGLKVAGRTSSFWFRAKDIEFAEIGRKLKVEHILEGSVRKSGNRIRVTVQLVQSTDGFQLWSERYDRELSDVFAVQDEISQAIARALQLKLAPKAEEPRYRPNLPAYEAFLKGRHELDKLTPEGLELSRVYIEQAIALDPGFADAYALSAFYYFLLADFVLAPAREMMPLAKSQARKALSLNPALPEAHALLGSVASTYDYDWKEADRSFELAVASHPVPPRVRWWRSAFYLLPLGRLKESIADLENGLVDDPLHAPVRCMLGIVLIAAGMYQRANAEFDRGLEIDPAFWASHLQRGICRMVEGRMEEAKTALEEAYRLAPFYPDTAGVLAAVCVKCGERERATALLSIIEHSDSLEWKAMGLSTFHDLCGEVETAAGWVEKLVDQRNVNFTMHMRTPLHHALLSSPHWPSIARKMNLPEAF